LTFVAEVPQGDGDDLDRVPEHQSGEGEEQIIDDLPGGAFRRIESGVSPVPRVAAVSVPVHE
jgi:hypothetical protein